MKEESSKTNADPPPSRAEEIAAMRRAVQMCYCGWGPACSRWQRLTPRQRVECSLDHRLIAQRYWKNGM